MMQKAKQTPAFDETLMWLGFSKLYVNTKHQRHAVSLFQKSSTFRSFIFPLKASLNFTLSFLMSHCLSTSESLPHSDQSCLSLSHDKTANSPASVGMRYRITISYFFASVNCAFFRLPLSHHFCFR